MKDHAVVSAVALLATAVVFACEKPLPLSSTTGGTVADLVISPKNVTLHLNDTVEFTAAAFMSTGDSANVTVTWSATYGTVTDMGTNSNGKRHYGQYKAAGTAPGQYKVVATSSPAGLSDTATVSVTLAPVAAVSLAPSSATVVAGATLQLQATLSDSGGNVLTGRTITWASNNGSVATVNGSGLVTASSPGSANIAATSEGQSATASITVSSVPVASVTVAPATLSLQTGQTGQLTATPKDANGNPLSGRVVTWSSSNTSVATVNGNGLVTAGATGGSATITATSEGQSGTATVTVTFVPVASVTVSPATASLQVGQTTQLTATPKDANGNPLSGRVVTWSSNNSTVASVSASGLVTASAAGSATITATSEGQSGTATVTVTFVPVASVTVSPATASLQVGQTTQLTATPKDANGNPLSGRVVTWSSNNTTVATVNGTGLVTAKAAGSATITATSEGQSGTSSITVAQAPVATVTVNPSSAAVQPGQTVQLAAITKDANGNVLTGRVVTWSSGDQTIATVNGTGLVNGVKAGTVSVTATSEGKSGNAMILVGVTPPPAGCAPTGSGTCYWVDAAAGNDGNPGDSAHPFQTVQHAADLVNPGDMVIVRDGVYTGGGDVVSIGRGGSPGNLVVFRSQHKWGAVLDGQNNLSATVVHISTNYVRVEGFEMKGSNHYGVDPSTGTTDIQIAGNNIHDVGRYCESSGIGLSAIDAYSDNLIIEGNWVHDIGRFAAGENGCQPGNDYWMNHDHGVYNGQGTNIIIRNNVFYNITRGWGIQRYGSSVDQLYIVNNTFAFPNPNRDGQIILAATTTNLFIENNIFYLPGQNVGISGTQSGAIIDHNLSTGTVGGGGTGTNIENTDPMFVNPTGLDFHLQPGSPAINAGLALQIVLFDYDGIARPVGGAWDIGAFEFH